MSTQTKRTTTTTTTRQPKRNRNRPARRGRNRNRQGQRTVPTSSAIHMAPCTRMYAKALVNPFAVQGLPCIPDNIVLPSFKFMTKARGVFSTGTNGVGFIALDPFQMLVNDNSSGVGHFAGAVVYTQINYTGTAMQIPVDAGPSIGIAIANPNSQFATTDFDTDNVPTYNRQFRLVGAGLRIKYIGSNLYNQGRLILWRNQGNDNTPQVVITASQLLQDNYTTITSVTRSDRYVYYVPDDPRFIAYNSFNEFSSTITTDNTPNHYSMGIYIDGGAVGGNQQSWEFEAVAFFEVIGKGFTLSRSEGDPVGHDIVMSSLPNAAPAGTPQGVENSVLSQFAKGFADTTREVAYYAGRKAIPAALNAAGSIYNYYNSSSRQLLLT